MSTELPKGRWIGVPEGTTERIERKVRTTYPDGTVTETEPERVNGRGQVMTWAKVADMFAGIQRPPGARTQEFTRKVTTIAEPWSEVVPDDEQKETTA